MPGGSAEVGGLYVGFWPPPGRKKKLGLYKRDSPISRTLDSLSFLHIKLHLRLFTLLNATRLSPRGLFFLRLK